MAKAKRVFVSTPPAIWIIIILVTVFSFTAENYFSFGNFTTVLNQAAPLLILALGQTLVVLTQGTDLSLGSSISMVTVLWVTALSAGIPMVFSMILAVLAAVLAGTINGLVVAFWKLPPFIATLGMQYILKTVALVVCDGSSVYYEHPLITNIGSGSILFIPVSVWIAAVFYLLTWFLLYKLRFGAHIVALGGNADALTLVGGNTRLTQILTFTYAGFMAGIAGLLVACRIESGNPLVGIGWEFNALAAVLLGGTSLREGKGGILGTIFGVLLVQILKSGLNSIGVPSIMQSMVIGVVIISAIIFDASLKRSYE